MARIEVKPLDWLGLEFFLLSHLSEADRRELLGRAPTDNLLVIAAHIMHAAKAVGRMLWRNGHPVAAM